MQGHAYGYLKADCFANTGLNLGMAGDFKCPLDKVFHSPTGTEWSWGNLTTGFGRNGPRAAAAFALAKQDLSSFCGFSLL